MKTAYGLLRKKTQLITTLILLLSALPNLSFGQKSSVTIGYDCIEYIGDGSGRYSVNFWYENAGSETVVVEESSSLITYNHGQSKKYGTSTFLPGKHEKVITQELEADDRVVWMVIMPNDKVKEVSADINSNHCRGIEFLTPYYTPPPGGKLKGSLIGTELNALYEKSILEGDNFKPVSDDIFQIDESFNVFIEVVSKDGYTNDLVGELNILVPTLSASIDDFLLNRATYWFPIRLLIELNDFTFLNYARPVFTEIPKVIFGQGDESMRSDYTRLGFNKGEFDLDGSNVRVGVISNSYNTKGQASDDIANGYLPSGVEVLEDIITPQGFSLTDEGRAMMQIVHQVAPGAKLVFRTGFLGELDMAKGIRDLANEDKGNCDIIVDDITYITEPFFRDGIISKAIDDVVEKTSNPVTYFSSAGNFGNSSCEGVFRAGNAVTGIKGKPHNFENANGQDIFQLINLQAGTYTLVLQWDDGTDPDLQAVTETDMDIFLSNNDGTSLLGYNRVNTGGAPLEVLPFKVSENNVAANILIVKASGPNRPVAFKYVVFRGGQGFDIQQFNQGSSTIVGHPNAEGSIAVGAVRYHQTPAYGEDIVVENFSSTGGTPIMTFTLDSPVSDPIIRNKPDFTAPDGVNTSVNLSPDDSGDYDHDTDPDTDTQPNFFGTSAAAPHAAGVAALIIQAWKKYNVNPLDNQEAATEEPAPAVIRSLMRSTAIGNEVNNGNIEHNEVSGFGFIQPYAAIKTFANPKPEIEELQYPDGVTPGEAQNPITFTIKGNFFVDKDDVHPNRKTKVKFRKEYLDDNLVTITGDTTITVNHPGFLGNPEIRVENPAISLSGQDGGVSEPIFFSTPSKQEITITALSFTKKYGEPLPDFSEVIFEDDLPKIKNANIDFSGLTPAEEFRILQRLSFDVKATSTSSVYPSYKIRLVFQEPDPTEEPDQAISEKYEIEIVDGLLNIQKLAVKITPKDAAIGYGQILTQNMIDFEYILGSDNVDDQALEDLKLKYTNPLPLGVPLVNGISLVRGTALVNVPEEDPLHVAIDDYGIIYLGEDSVIYNGQPLPRGVALVNGHPFVQIEEIINGVGMFNKNEVSFVRVDDASYMTALGDVELDEPIAVENGIALVRGTALVNGYEIKTVVSDDGLTIVTTIGDALVDAIGIALVNGVTFVRGTALVNSEHIVRGTALVNGVPIPIENGIPDVGVNAFNIRGVALVNGIPVRGTALVNGIPVNVRGTALVNGLYVVVTESGVITVNGEVANSITNGIALVRGTALVNGKPSVIGTALVNGETLVRGVALVNGIPAGLDLNEPNYELNVNFLASTNSLDSLTFVNGSPLVDGIVGVESQQLAEAVYPINNSFTSVRGIALVNGLYLFDGLAQVDGYSVVRGTALVNETITAESFNGTITINYRAEESSSYVPVTFITGTNAGEHKIIPGTFFSDNFDISYGVGTLTIEKAELEIKTDIIFKNQSTEDPPLTIESYMLDEVPNYVEFDGTLEGVVLYGDDHLSGSYVRDDGEEVGPYDYWIEDLSAGNNYNISPIGEIPGIFYINPYGPGTRAIKPVLNCVEVIDAATNHFVANFAYKNDNDSAVFVPLGPDNLLEGDIISMTDITGTIALDHQPTLFANGGGEFKVEFFGDELRWTVNSLDEDHKASNAASANSSSTKCKTNVKSAGVSSAIEEEELPGMEDLMVYPNPVTNKVNLVMKDIEDYKMIMLLDVTGRTYPITSIKTRSDRLEIDMSQLASGPYFIKVVMEDSIRVITLIKK